MTKETRAASRQTRRNDQFVHRFRRHSRASERLVLLRDEGVRVEGWLPRLWLHYRWGRFLGWLDGWRRR